MASLRWTLLGIGALFVLGLMLWERIKRSRTVTSMRADVVPGSSPEPRVRPAPRDAADDDDPQPDETPVARHEPSFGAHATARDTRRESLRDPPIVDLDVAKAQTAASQVAAIQTAAARQAQHDELDDDNGEYLTQPLDAELDMRGMRVESMSGAEDASHAERWIAAAGVRALRSEDLILDWPADDQRTVIALRVEARGAERLGGRSVRQALQGEGFIFGKLDIFHLPLGDGRVIVSAASLTKPGGFTLQSMDSQTFLGLNLFTVLPGPLAGIDALERLVASGRLLAQRLRADLLDTQGQPLSEARLLDMRSRLANTRAAASAVAAAAGADRV